MNSIKPLSHPDRDLPGTSSSTAQALPQDCSSCGAGSDGESAHKARAAEPVFFPSPRSVPAAKFGLFDETTTSPGGVTLRRRDHDRRLAPTFTRPASVRLAQLGGDGVNLEPSQVYPVVSATSPYRMDESHAAYLHSVTAGPSLHFRQPNRTCYGSGDSSRDALATGLRA